MTDDGDITDCWDKHIDALNRGATTESNKALGLCQQNVLIIAEQMILATKREDTITQQTFTFPNFPLNNVSSCSSASLMITQHVEGLAIKAKATQSDG